MFIIKSLLVFSSHIFETCLHDNNEEINNYSNSKPGSNQNAQMEIKTSSLYYGGGLMIKQLGDTTQFFRQNAHILNFNTIKVAIISKQDLQVFRDINSSGRGGSSIDLGSNRPRNTSQLVSSSRNSNSNNFITQSPSESPNDMYNENRSSVTSIDSITLMLKKTNSNNNSIGQDEKAKAAASGSNI